jgi:hypothetical protein
VVCRCHYLEVLEAVVGAVTVDVMDVLVGAQLSPKVLLHYVPVFCYPCAWVGDFDPDVPAAIDPSSPDWSVVDVPVAGMPFAASKCITVCPPAHVVRLAIPASRVFLVASVYFAGPSSGPIFLCRHHAPNVVARPRSVAADAGSIYWFARGLADWSPVFDGGDVLRVGEFAVLPGDVRDLLGGQDRPVAHHTFLIGSDDHVAVKRTDVTLLLTAHRPTAIISSTQRIAQQAPA